MLMLCSDDIIRRPDGTVPPVRVASLKSSMSRPTWCGVVSVSESLSRDVTRETEHVEMALDRPAVSWSSYAAHFTRRCLHSFLFLFFLSLPSPDGPLRRGSAIMTSGAGGGIRTHEPLRDGVLSPAPLTRLGDPRALCPTNTRLT